LDLPGRLQVDRDFGFVLFAFRVMNFTETRIMGDCRMAGTGQGQDFDRSVSTDWSGEDQRRAKITRGILLTGITRGAALRPLQFILRKLTIIGRLILGLKPIDPCGRVSRVACALQYPWSWCHCRAGEVPRSLDLRPPILLVGRWLLGIGETILGSDAPSFAAFTKACKQVSENIVFANQGTSFRKVGMIEYPGKGLWSIGVRIGASRRGCAEASLPGEEDYVSCFLPCSPNPTTGFFLYLKKSDVVELSISTDEAAQARRMSAGLIQPVPPGVKTH